MYDGYYTIQEIRNYLLSKDSMGDILYYLDGQNIIDANRDNEDDDEDEDENEPVNEDGEIFCSSCKVYYRPDDICGCYGR